MAMHAYDITWLKEEDPDWKSQITVPQAHTKATVVALFHSGMYASDIMQYLGGTYTGEH